MKRWLGRAVFVGLLVASLLLGVGNPADVELHFLFWSARLPLGVLLAICATSTAFVTALVCYFFWHWPLRRALRKSQQTGKGS
jgi:uncharacterized integral membrane protein